MIDPLRAHLLLEPLPFVLLFVCFLFLHLIIYLAKHGTEDRY